MNFMQLGPQASVPTIMHELGHVMGTSMLSKFSSFEDTFTGLHADPRTIGMSHEHQRVDRDEHALFQCQNIPGQNMPGQNMPGQNIPGYFTALYAARNTYGNAFTSSMLCDNM
jgi:hypothetical protein